MALPRGVGGYVIDAELASAAEGGEQVMTTPNKRTSKKANRQATTTTPLPADLIPTAAFGCALHLPSRRAEPARFSGDLIR